MLQPMGVSTQGGSFGAPSTIRPLPSGNGSFDENGPRARGTVIPVRSRKTLLLSSVLSSMQNSKDCETVSVNSVGNNIGRACHDEFACFWFAAGAAEMRMLGKAFHGGEYALRHAACCRGLILFDVLPNSDQIGDGCLSPDYSHDGGGSSRFLPQERSHRAVFSCEMMRPVCTSFFPLRMAASCHS